MQKSTLKKGGELSDFEFDCNIDDDLKKNEKTLNPEVTVSSPIEFKPVNN